jgi:hypothetical protein
MKPRLKVGALTDEDSAIWGMVVRRASAYPMLITSRAIDAWNADRRDADLMFWAQECRSHELRHVYLTAKNIGGVWCGVAWYYRDADFIFCGGQQ